MTTNQAHRAPEPAPELRLVGDAETTPDSSQEERDWHRLVIETFQEIAQTACKDEMTLDGLLRLVGRRLCELLGVTRCSVYLRREDGQFQGQVGYCAGAPSIDAKVSRLVSGVDSFTSEIVQTSSPVIVHDATKDPRTYQRTMRQWRVKDMLGVPLVAEGQVIGIIYVDDQARTHDFTDRDIRLAEAFAGLCAYAVKQAWQWQRLLAKARAADQERRVLGWAAKVRAQVTAALTQGADAADILQLAADALAKPLVLYNRRFKATSWTMPEGTAELTAPILDQSRAESPALAPLVAKLEAKGASVVIRATPELKVRRLLTRLASGEETLGYLELYEIGSGLGPADGRVLEELAAVLALKLRLDQRFGSREVVSRMDYFVDLMFGRRDPAVLTARASSFDLDPAAEHIVMLVPVTSDEATSEHARPDREALATDLAAELSDALRLIEHVSIPGNHLVLFEIVDVESGHAQLRSRLETAAQHFGERHRIPRLVLTDFCGELGEVAEAVRQALGVSELLARHPSDQPIVAFARDLELLRLAAQGGDLDEAVRSAQQLLRPLLEYDATSGGGLVDTLRSFIDCGAQYRSTAVHLGVHENTVRYRLNRVGQISSIDPMSFPDLTRAQMAFQVARLVPSVTKLRAESRPATTALA